MIPHYLKVVVLLGSADAPLPADSVSTHIALVWRQRLHL